MRLTSLFFFVLLSLVSFQVFAGDASNLRPQPGGKPADMTKPVQVFILRASPTWSGAGQVLWRPAAAGARSSSNPWSPFIRETTIPMLITMC